MLTGRRSIIPCLALRGVGTAIARSKTLRAKVLLLNTTHDRETKGMAAVDYVRCVSFFFSVLVLVLALLFLF